MDLRIVTQFWVFSLFALSLVLQRLLHLEVPAQRKQKKIGNVDFALF